jgi:flagellar biosynthesis protein FlhB
VLKIVETGGFGAKRWASFTGYRATFHGRLTRLFTRQGALEQICAIAIPLLIGSYCLISMRTHAQLVAATLGTFRGGIAVVLVSTKQLLWVAFAAWAGVGCLELALSYRFWLSRLMMSPEDRRLELKETEGDPLVRLHRSRIQHQMLLESSQWSMSEGTLVIQAAMQIAVVLHYDPTEISAPRLLGVGSADLAAMIVAEAHRFDVPVIEHPTLPQRVAGGNVGAPIEEALYAPIAEIMSQAGLVF